MPLTLKENATSFPVVRKKQLAEPNLYWYTISKHGNTYLYNATSKAESSNDTHIRNEQTFECKIRFFDFEMQPMITLTTTAEHFKSLFTFTVHELKDLMHGDVLVLTC